MCAQLDVRTEFCYLYKVTSKAENPLLTIPISYLWIVSKRALKPASDGDLVKGPWVRGIKGWTHCCFCVAKWRVVKLPLKCLRSSCRVVLPQASINEASICRDLWWLQRLVADQGAENKWLLTEHALEAEGALWKRGMSPVEEMSELNTAEQNCGAILWA